jgi:hypothetical protein
MKKNLGWITMAAVVASSPLSQARAGETAVPFQACKNVALVDSDAAIAKYEKEHPGCHASVAISSPGFGAHVNTTMEAVKISNVLAAVGERQVLPDLKARKKYWEGVKACFDNPGSSANCKKQMETIKSAYGGFVGKLRSSLAQANVAQNEKLSAGSDLKPFTKSALPGLAIPNAFPEAVVGGLSADEVSAANSAKKASLGQASAAYTKDLIEGVQKNGLYLVSYLPKPTVGADGSAQWDSKVWSSTIDRLIKDADKEISATDAAIKKGNVKVPSFGTKDLVPGWGKEERDLMFVATLTPEMEKFLVKHPDQCGAAIAAAKWMDSISDEKIVASVASFAVGGGLTKMPSAIKSFGTLGKAVYAGSMAGGGALGVSMLMADHANTIEKAEKEYRALAKIGAEKGKEADIADPKKYAEAQTAADKWWSSQIAAQGGFLLGGAAVGLTAKMAAPAIAKAWVATGPAVAENLGRIAMKFRGNAKKFASALEKEVPSEYRGTLGKNLTSREFTRQVTLAEKMGPRLDKMATDPNIKMNPNEVDQVEKLVADAEPNVAARLEAEGKCHGEACDGMAANEIGHTTDDAIVHCTTPGKGGPKI